MALGVGRLPEALGKARDLEMRGTAFLERQAGLEEALRLAPELGLRTQAPEGGEQLRVAAALDEPAFGALDAYKRLLGALGCRELRRQLAVEADQLGVAFRGERVLQDLARE